MPGKENKTPNFTGTGWCCRICERDFKTRSNMIDHNHTRLHKLKQATASVGRENELLKSQLGYANKTIKDRRSSWIANTRLLKENVKLKEELSTKQEIINAYIKQADDEHIRFLDEQVKRSDLQLEKDYWENEYQELRKKVNLGTIEDRDLRIEELIKKNNEQYEEIKKLKDRLKTVQGFC
tara:strand:+ start:264 stop:806 length:543 start_codon:yes stop_codon:yes gene_type:complete